MRKIAQAFAYAVVGFIAMCAVRLINAWPVKSIFNIFDAGFFVFYFGFLALVLYWNLFGKKDNRSK
jgi:hypothetical protein